MPYFKWEGVTITGDKRNGYLFAPSQALLDEQLFKTDVALIKVWPKNYWLCFYRINGTLRAYIFEQIAMLLNAGIRLPEALFLVARQSSNPRVQKVLFECAHDVQTGNTLSNAARQHPELFSELACCVLHIGQETNSLSTSLDLLVNYLKMKASLRRAINTALLMPCITFTFVIAIAAIIFGAVIPQLSNLINKLGTHIPSSTQRLLAISDVVRSRYMIIIIALFICSICLLKLFFSCSPGKKFKAWLLTHIPGIASITLLYAQTSFFQSMYLLLSGNMSLVQALHTTSTITQNNMMKGALIDIAHHVDHGISLSDSLIQYPSLFAPDVIALIAAAQESTALKRVFKTLSTIYADRFEKLLRFLVTLIGPIMILLLGLMIALLIMAVYGPIMNLSYQL